MSPSDSRSRIAPKSGMSRSKSNSSELILELDLDKSLKRFLRALIGGNRREAGRACNANMKSSDKF